MIRGIGQTANVKYTLNFGTHSYVFHCDDTTGIAILETAFMDTETRGGYFALLLSILFL